MIAPGRGELSLAYHRRMTEDMCMAAHRFFPGASDRREILYFTCDLTTIPGLLAALLESTRSNPQHTSASRGALIRSASSHQRFPSVSQALFDFHRPGTVLHVGAGSMLFSSPGAFSQIFLAWG